MVELEEKEQDTEKNQVGILEEQDGGAGNPGGKGAENGVGNKNDGAGENGTASIGSISSGTYQEYHD